jgi:hypothetical protein
MNQRPSMLPRGFWAGLLLALVLIAPLFVAIVIDVRSDDPQRVAAQMPASTAP